MIRHMVVAFSMAALTVATTASTQENATFTLRSGERLSGQLMDLGGVGFTVRIDGQERRIAPTDLAVIDFTGGGTSQADWDRLSSGQFAVLRDGQIVTGQLIDIGGSSPLRLSFSVNGANRDFQSNAVARIVLARPNEAVATPTPPIVLPTTPPGSIMVPARQRWTATGISARRGETLTISATGEISFAGAGSSPTSPNGSSERRPDNPVPSATTGTLIGRIGNGQPFAIGSQASIPAPATGQLFLSVNDTHLDDNDGAFQVQVQQRAARTRR